MLRNTAAALVLKAFSSMTITRRLYRCVGSARNGWPRSGMQASTWLGRKLAESALQEIQLAAQYRKHAPEELERVGLGIVHRKPVCP